MVFYHFCYYFVVSIVLKRKKDNWKRRFVFYTFPLPSVLFLPPALPLLRRLLGKTYEKRLS